MFAPVAFQTAFIGNVIFIIDQLDTDVEMIMRNDMGYFRRNSLNDGVELQLPRQQTGNTEIMLE
jgi:hypothetical protein